MTLLSPIVAAPRHLPCSQRDYARPRRSRKLSAAGGSLFYLRSLVLVVATLGMAARLTIAQAGVLVSLDDSWSYRLLGDASVTVEDAWREPGFDDAGWATGIGGFRASAPGIWDATQLPGSSLPWMTVCFRTRFELAEPDALNWLILRADYEDGLVAFLNGTEVARRALPETGLITRETAALTAGRKLGEPILLDLPPGTLIAGTNTLVVEVHKSALEKTEVAFKAELVTDFQRGPVVQNVSSNRVTITWHTPLPADATVRYGLSNSLTGQVYRAELQTNHVLTLANLEPATAYNYQIRSRAGGREATSPVFSFRTLQTAGPIEFVVVGDTGSGGPDQRRLRDVLRAQAGDFVLHTGDLVYHFLTESTVDLKHFSIYRDDLAERPFFSVYGNHELFGGDQPYLDTFELPTNNLTGTEHYYSFDHGEVHFSALFLTQRAQAVSWPEYRMEEGSPQYRWLTNDLATTTKPWKVVIGHVPLASSGGRRPDAYNGLRDQVEYQRILLPIFERYGVQLYLSGHDHIYERVGPLRGVHSLVSGGGGYILYGLSERDPASARFFSRYNVVRITVDSDRLSAVALDDSLRVIDRFGINRTPPGTDLPPAVWHLPAPVTGEEDGDGNRRGQVFDLPGPGTWSVAGRSANLGELCVAVDSDYTHLGLRHVMLPHSQSLMLFVALPGVDGVASLAELGDRVPQPAKEGVEALDALASLEFDSFRPSIACVLGDEFGDTTARSFPLAQAGVDSGQGVFWLQPGFPEVAGALVQQFDESPQLEIFPEERRTDYVVVSLPRSLMDPSLPGAAVQIGAVAARAGAALDGSGLVAEVDSGYLGRGLATTGTNWVLQGLSIPLPADSDEDADGLRVSEELTLGTAPNDPDSDGDSLADGWEAHHLLDPLDASGLHGSEGDPDGDGFPNRSEQVAGTDPRDRTSVLRITLQRRADGAAEMTWFGQSGRTYLLQVAAAPSGPYTPLPGADFPRPGQDRAETYPLPVDDGNRYYQVRVVAP